MDFHEAVGLVKQGSVAGKFVLAALLPLGAAYWVYRNPETPGWVMGVGGYDVILVWIIVVAVFFARKKRPLER